MSGFFFFLSSPLEKYQMQNQRNPTNFAVNCRVQMCLQTVVAVTEYLSAEGQSLSVITANMG